MTSLQSSVLELQFQVSQDPAVAIILDQRDEQNLVVVVSSGTWNRQNRSRLRPNRHLEPESGPLEDYFPLHSGFPGSMLIFLGIFHLSSNCFRAWMTMIWIWIRGMNIRST